MLTQQTRLRNTWAAAVLSVVLLITGCAPAKSAQTSGPNITPNTPSNNGTPPASNSTKPAGDVPAKNPDRPTDNTAKNTTNEVSRNTTGNLSPNTPNNGANNTTPKPAGPTVLPVMAASSLKLVYADNFSSNRSGWPIGTFGNLSYVYVDRGYQMFINQQGFVFPITNNRVPQQTNFVAEATAKLLSANGTSSSFGLVFQADDKGNYYAFTIKGDRYSIWKHNGQDYGTVQPDTYSSYIKNDGSPIQLRVARLDKTIEVYVNGERLTTVVDDTLSRGTIGFMVTDVVSAVFSDFKIYNFNEEYIRLAAPNLLPKIVATQSVGPTGGIIAATLPGNISGTMQITVPKDTVTDTQAFQVTAQEAISPNPDFYAGSPLLTVTSGGGSFKSPIKISIPVKYAADEFPMVFTVDDGGNFEPVGTTTLNQTFIGVNFYNFPKTIRLVVFTAKKFPVKPLTGFTPGYDDWEFYNLPTYTSNEGICTGMSMTALYYFNEVSSKGKGSPLSRRYLGNNTRIKEDDRQAIRMASLVQQAYENSAAYHDNAFYYSANVPLIISSSVNGDSITYRSFLAAMTITKQPQLIGMLGRDKSNNSTVGHCMIAYSVTPDGIMVADPNDPGGSQLIPFKNGRLGPYNTDITDPKSGELYDNFLFIGKGGAFLSWSTIGDHWSKIDDKTIGDGVFPQASIKVVDTKGKVYADKIKNGDNISVNGSHINLLPALASGPFVLLIYQQKDYFTKPVALVPANMTINLTSGDNLIGILVASLDLTNDPEMDNALWTDFIWITISCNTSETWKAVLSGSSRLSTAMLNHNYVVDFTVPGSLADACRNTGYVSGKGVVNGGSNVVSQSATSDTQVRSGSVSSLNVTVSAPHWGGEIYMFSINEAPIVLYSYTFRGTPYQANGFKGFVLIPRNITETTITGDWRTADISGYTLGGLSGTFTLTKQE